MQTGHSRDFPTRAGRAERGGRRLLAAAALVALAAAPVAPGGLGAQQASTPRARPAQAPAAAAPVAEAELAEARRLAADADRRLRALVASLAGRETTRATVDSVVRLQRERERLVARLRFLEARTRFRATEVEVRRQLAPSEPEGWFGVNVTTVAGAGVSPDGLVLHSAEYPIVRSVEPGSPAARAGMLAGDRLVAILGRDLRSHELDLARVLRPGTRVPVHVVRDGRPLDLTVAITARPSSFGPSRIQVATVERGEAAAPDAPRRVRVFERAAPAPRPAAGEGARTVPRPSSYLFTSSPSVAPVAGAEVMTLTAGLRSTHGVDGGIFVVSVLPRTPADLAGLAAGDVLVTADGARLDEPLDFLRVVRREASGDRHVRIELVRQKRPRTVDMRW